MTPQTNRVKLINQLTLELEKTVLYLNKTKRISHDDRVFYDGYIKGLEVAIQQIEKLMK